MTSTKRKVGVKKTIILLMIIAVLISFTSISSSAGTYVSDDAEFLQHNVHFNETSAGNIADTKSGELLTYTANTPAIFNIESPLGIGINYTDTSTSSFQWASSDMKNITSTDNYALCFFGIIRSSASATYIFGNHQDSGGEGIGWLIGADGKFSVASGGSPSLNPTDGCPVITSNNWVSMCIVVNGSGITGNYNNTAVCRDGTFTTPGTASYQATIGTGVWTGDAKNTFYDQFLVFQPAPNSEALTNMHEAWFSEPPVDTTPPYFTDDATNNSEPYIDDVVNVSITINDIEALDSYIFSYYNGSLWLNDSVLYIGGTSYDAQKITVMPNQDYYNYTWYANDSSNNWNKSNDYYLDIQGIRDITVPYFTNNATNSSVPRIEDSVNFSITINDNINVSAYIFSYFNGTLWLNDTLVEVTGTSYDASVAKTITNTSYYNYTWYANDTSNNWNKSDEYYLEIWTPDETIPEFNTPTTNDTWTVPYAHVKIAINITDNVNVSGYIFSFYNGTWNNDSYVEDVSDDIYASVVKIMTNLTYYNYTWYANDTSDNWAISSDYFLRINHFPPTFSNMSINSSYIRVVDEVLLSIVINDSNPDKAYVEWNITGGIIKSTPVSYTNGENVSTYKLIIQPHVYTCWRYYANDTAGNGAFSDYSCFQVENSVPSTPTVIAPLDDTNVSTLNIYYSSADTDEDVLYYLVYLNNTLEFNSTTNTTDYSLADGDYSLKVQTYDGYDYSGNSSEIVFTKITGVVVDEEDVVFGVVSRVVSAVLIIVILVFMLIKVWEAIKRKGKGGFEK